MNSGADVKVIFVATGSEVSLAVKASQLLLQESNIASRIVSMPCTELFDEQPLAYKLSVIPDGIPVISIVRLLFF